MWSKFFSTTSTYHLWKPTFANKRFPVLGHGFPSQGVLMNDKLVYFEMFEFFFGFMLKLGENF